MSLENITPINNLPNNTNHDDSNHLLPNDLTMHQEELQTIPLSSSSQSPSSTTKVGHKKTITRRQTSIKDILLAEKKLLERSSDPTPSFSLTNNKNLISLDFNNIQQLYLKLNTNEPLSVIFLPDYQPSSSTSTFQQNNVNVSSSFSEFDVIDLNSKKQTITTDNNSLYKLIPDNVPYTHPIFLSGIDKLRRVIEKEFKTMGPHSQIIRDAILWRRTLDNPEYKNLGNILRRIFCVIRFGGLMYRQNEKSDYCNAKWNMWYKTNYPIASVLSHGSRVIIQLEKMNGENSGDHLMDEHSFWKWLITGKPDGDVSKYISTKTSGNEARIEGKIIFRRLGATHALDYLKDEDLSLLIHQQEDIKYDYSMSSSMMSMSNTATTNSSMGGSLNSNLGIITRESDDFVFVEKEGSSSLSSSSNSIYTHLQLLENQEKDNSSVITDNVTNNNEENLPESPRNSISRQRSSRTRKPSSVRPLPTTNNIGSFSTNTLNRAVVMEPNNNSNNNNTVSPKIIDTSKYSLKLPFGKKKLIHETKTFGITLRDTKIFRTDNSILKHHRHWGMNLPIGGAENTSLSGKKIECNGEHGHLYIYYQSPKEGRYGGLLIGVEGSEFSKFDQGGGYHGLSAKSPLFSPTFGYKWRAKSKNGKIAPDLSSISGPDKYNSLFVDLTSGWRFLIDKYEKEWNDDFVMKTSLPPN
ncbi:hypothetical protein ABK040_008235 [Willaertia magna]